MQSARSLRLLLPLVLVVYRSAAAEEQPPFGTHSKPVEAVAFSADGRYLAVSEAGVDKDESSASSIKLFDAAGNAVHEFKTKRRGQSFTFSPDSNLFAIVHPSIEGTLWRLPAGEACGKLPACSRRAAFAGDGLLVLLNYDNIIRYDVVRGQVATTQGFQAPQGKWNHDPATAAVISPDGSLLAANGGDRTVKVWSVSDGELKHELAGHTAAIVFLAFAPDGKTLVSTAGGQKSSGELIVWDMEKAERQSGLEQLQGLHNTIYSAAFSADGMLLAWTAGGTQIEICDAKTCVRKGVVRRRSLKARQLAFSPDGKWLASIDSAGRLAFWKVADALDAKSFLTTDNTDRHG